MKLLTWHISAWEDYLYWQDNDKDNVKKINGLLKDILRNPFSGLGKPEPLVGNYKGYWSSRINQEHRLIYKVENKMIIVASCRFHY
ncbi:MAG: Txe/YoeB family addiction module toxin [Saprospiraceae bacterium]|nr:Txe/YoeB family addiction module toxin [Saprospiraceae bacterium]